MLRQGGAQPEAGQRAAERADEHDPGDGGRTQAGLRPVIHGGVRAAIGRNAQAATPEAHREGLVIRAAVLMMASRTGAFTVSMPGRRPLLSSRPRRAAGSQSEQTDEDRHDPCDPRYCAAGAVSRATPRSDGLRRLRAASPARVPPGVGRGRKRLRPPAGARRALPRGRWDAACPRSPRGRSLTRAGIPRSPSRRRRRTSAGRRRPRRCRA